MSSDSGEEVTVDMKGVHWNNAMVVKLVESVNDQVTPPDLFLPYDKVPIDWTKVADNVGMDAEKCEVRWNTVLKCVRTFRTLPEIMLDIQTQYSKLGIKKANIDNRPVQIVQPVKETPKKRVKKVVNPDHPKKPPVNGYSAFCSQMMPQVVGTVGIHKFVRLSEMWKELSDSEKEKFNEKSRKLKKEYIREVRSYAEQHPDDEIIQGVLSDLQPKKKPASKRVSTKMHNNELDTKSENNRARSTDDDDMSHVVSPKKKLKIGPPKKKSKKVRTGESVYVNMKIENYRAEHPDHDEEYLVEKLRRKYAKLSDLKKEKYETLAQEEN